MCQAVHQAHARLSGEWDTRRIVLPPGRSRVPREIPKIILPNPRRVAHRYYKSKIGPAREVPAAEYANRYLLVLGNRQRVAVAKISRACRFYTLPRDQVSAK